MRLPPVMTRAAAEVVELVLHERRRSHRLLLPGTGLLLLLLPRVRSSLERLLWEALCHGDLLRLLSGHHHHLPRRHLTHHRLVGRLLLLLLLLLPGSAGTLLLVVMVQRHHRQGGAPVQLRRLLHHTARLGRSEGRDTVTHGSLSHSVSAAGNILTPTGQPASSDQPIQPVALTIHRPAIRASQPANPDQPASQPRPASQPTNPGSPALNRRAALATSIPSQTITPTVYRT